VLAHLALRYLHSSAEVWRARIGRGQVELQGRQAAEADVLREGESLVWRRPPWREPAVPLAFAVLHRDEHLLAVAKPRGLPCLPNGGFLTHTLLHLVQRRWPEATPLHRLGRGTSGIVLFARSDLARRVVSTAWSAARVDKEYRALIAGVPRRDEWTIETPIGLLPHPRLGRVHAACASGKPAVTHVRLLAARGERAIVGVRIATGRPHQIRIHMAAAGHPLIGDPLYVAGGLPGPGGALPGEGAYRLHALRLGLAHPAGGRLEVWCAPPIELDPGR
jgi:23S rRNA pseudouridine1911/1915/1917 synthase